jgi:hypothetical protein
MIISMMIYACTNVLTKYNKNNHNSPAILKISICIQYDNKVLRLDEKSFITHTEIY